ncbi:transaldolase [Litoribrevibacter albus]|uniref:Transaldolase n=1 Tax=Litoribrevibacter albus TaxID=1473156 RepID=A0AA37W4M5_9GAMM|nr:transaldolase [Litoribrevibacter albus]GLQ30312.1 transaldolase [Litoribrevibacter albus]
MENNKLNQLKAMTQVVADTGDIDAIKLFKPVDATTNPSLMLKASELPHYQDTLKNALAWAKGHASDAQQQVALACDKFGVDLGSEITGIIPGYISTEVDARLSFDTQATIAKAKQIIELYEANGIGKDRVLIKIASTWEGIKAAEALQQEGINCNLTLIFSFAQAVAAAEANAFLISPFVGRILDWYKASTGEDYSAETDPGVISVTKIYNYFKQHGHKTVVMGASFRNTGEIEQLAGCDRLTISPALLSELEQDTAPLEQKLFADQYEPMEAVHFDEASFRWAMNEDAMATEKLAEGIRNFTKDQIKLEQKIASLA